jgi:hypothetical protein
MFALLSSLDVHERFGSWCQSRPKGVFYTLASSKFMENFATLNVALVAECGCKERLWMWRREGRDDRRYSCMGLWFTVLQR